MKADRAEHIGAGTWKLYTSCQNWTGLSFWYAELLTYFSVMARVAKRRVMSSVIACTAKRRIMC